MHDSLKDMYDRCGKIVFDNFSLQSNLQIWKMRTIDSSLEKTLKRCYKLLKERLICQLYKKFYNNIYIYLQ